MSPVTVGVLTQRLADHLPGVIVLTGYRSNWSKDLTGARIGTDTDLTGLVEQGSVTGWRANHQTRQRVETLPGLDESGDPLAQMLLETTS